MDDPVVAIRDRVRAALVAGGTNPASAWGMVDGLVANVAKRERANVARELRDVARDPSYTIAHYADPAVVDRIADEIERSR